VPSTTLLVIKQKENGLLPNALILQIQRIQLDDLTAAASSYTNEQNMRRLSQEAEHRRVSEGEITIFSMFNKI